MTDAWDEGRSGSTPLALATEAGRLHGRVAIVTGASQGIGRAVALALAIGGARVHLLGRHLERLQLVASHHPADCLPLVVDLTNREGVAAAAAELLAMKEPVDLLVHCGGKFVRGSVDDLDLQAIDEQLELSLNAPYQLTRLLLPRLRERPSDVVFVNTTARPASGLAAYAAGKAAQRALVDALREELRGQQIRVLSVVTGRTATAMQERVFELEGRMAVYRPDLLLQPSDVAAVVVDAISLHRRAEVMEVRIRPSAASY